MTTPMSLRQPSQETLEAWLEKQPPIYDSTGHFTLLDAVENSNSHALAVARRLYAKETAQ